MILSWKDLYDLTELHGCVSMLASCVVEINYTTELN